MMEKGFLKSLLVICAFTLAFSIAAWPAGAQDKIRLALDFIPDGHHVPLFAAQEEGFFKDEGIEINIVRGYGSADSVKQVGTGTVDFSLSSTVQLILGRSKGLKIKEIHMQMHKNPDTVFFLKGKGIKDPKDLEGKTVGYIPGGGLDKTIRAFAKAKKLDMDKITLSTVEPGQMFAALAMGRFNAVITYLYLKPAFDVAAAEKNEVVNIFMPSEYGVDLYSNGLTTTDALIEKNPDLVRRVTKVFSKGIWWSRKNTERALDDFMNANKGAKREVMKKQFVITYELLSDGLAEKQGVGFMDRDKMKKTLEFVEKYFEVKEGTVKLDDIYTNRFLEGLPKEWMFPGKLTL